MIGSNLLPPERQLMPIYDVFFLEVAKRQIHEKPLGPELMRGLLIREVL